MAGHWFSFYLERLKKEFPSKVFKKTDQSKNLFAILKAIANNFENLETDHAEYEKILNPLTATGFWLDFWGFFFGETRFINETDAEYAARLNNSVTYGRNSAEAIIEALRPISATEPQVIEPIGTILQNVDYKTLNYNTPYSGSAFSIIVKYRPKTIGANAAYVGRSYVGRNYIYTTGTSQVIVKTRAREIVNRTKLAGIKAIHDIS